MNLNAGKTTAVAFQRYFSSFGFPHVLLSRRLIFHKEKDAKGLEQKGVAFDKCCVGKFSSVGEKRAKSRDAERGGGGREERCETAGKTILVNFHW